jgi:starch synthase
VKVLVLYDYPPSAGGLATQGDLLFKGLREIGVDVYPAHFDSPQEKEWYYRWFEPDVVVGIGYWGHTPDLILHPLRYGARPVPWLVADGYIANYVDVLNSLPLILVTSNWVRETYIRDGIDPRIIEVLPVGCDTDTFIQRPLTDPKISSVRQIFGVAPDQMMILTIGGDAASKGALEVMQALALIDVQAFNWKYICKVWPQPRTVKQNLADLQQATDLGIEKNIIYATNTVSRNFMPYLIGACDIYAAPSRLEGFGMPQIEAGACGKPVIGIKAMAMLDTLVDSETAFLAEIAQEIRISETNLGEAEGYRDGHRIIFDPPRVAGYRANISDIAKALLRLMQDEQLRRTMGEAGRRRVVKLFNYKVVAQKFVEIISRRLSIS